MLTYRATLRPRSATLTPWHADTLFGHLCWQKRHHEGESALEGFLAEYRSGLPPLVLSNGFPGEWLPRPLLPPLDPSAERSKSAQVQAMKQAKADKAVRWVSLSEFNALRRGDQVALQAAPRLGGNRTVLKNQINRLTFGTTPIEEEAGGAGLYSADELAFVGVSDLARTPLDISVYVKARDELWAEQARQVLEWLSRSGYGAKKSSGYGQFRLAAWERFEGFDASPPETNGFVSLSHWVPARPDPRDGFYATMVKYGKLGEEMAATDNPFKYPLIMLTAGSSFYAGAPVREWYGRLVEGLAPVDPRVVQYGYAFAVPARLSGLGECP